MGAAGDSHSKGAPMSMVRKAGAAGITLALVLTPVVAEGVSGPPGHVRPGPGEPGAGDPYFPLAGNGGYDVQHYDLELRYTPPPGEELEGRLRGEAEIDLVPTRHLTRFNLDLRGMQVRTVRVDGWPARFAQEDNELVITPRRPLREGREVEVQVRYHGTTTQPRDIEEALYGWVTFADGAMVASESDGSATWFPVNDHPTDKATYEFEITVPRGYTAVANGTLEDVERRGRWVTWEWDAPDPMAAYLATATVGNFEMVTSTAPNGVPVLDFLDEDLTPANRATSEASLALTGEMMEFFEDRYGDYPFVSYGAIVDDDSVGYALETQTRSIFSRVAREGTVAHELAHQWMGNHVSPGRWADIWLNEGWATYSTWMWTEHRGGTTAQAAYEQVLAIPADNAFWDLVVSDPGALNLFHGAVYDRGAATLHALRLEIGDEAFFELARTWVERYGGGTATTADFRALAEEVSGQDLGTLFTVWLDTPERPGSW